MEEELLGADASVCVCAGGHTLKIYFQFLSRERWRERIPKQQRPSANKRRNVVFELGGGISCHNTILENCAAAQLSLLLCSLASLY